MRDRMLLWLGWVTVVTGFAIMIFASRAAQDWGFVLLLSGALLIWRPGFLRHPTWFDDPFWRDWLYWAGVGLLLLGAIFGALVREDPWSTFEPWWLALLPFALVDGWVLGILTGSVRAFVRGWREPSAG